MRTFCPLCISLPASVVELEDDHRRGLRTSIPRCWQRDIKAHNTTSLRKRYSIVTPFYGTFTTALPPSVILHSVKADDALSSEPVTVVAPRDNRSLHLKQRSAYRPYVRHT